MSADAASPGQAGDCYPHRQTVRPELCRAQPSGGLRRVVRRNDDLDTSVGMAEFAGPHPELVIAQWVSVIDRIATKPRRSRKPTREQRALRDELGNAAWRILETDFRFGASEEKVGGLERLRRRKVHPYGERPPKPRRRRFAVCSAPDRIGAAAWRPPEGRPRNIPSGGFPDSAHTGEPSPGPTGSDAPSSNASAVATSGETTRRFPPTGGVVSRAPRGCARPRGHTDRRRRRRCGIRGAARASGAPRVCGRLS